MTWENILDIIVDLTTFVTALTGLIIAIKAHGKINGITNGKDK